MGTDRPLRTDGLSAAHPSRLALDQPDYEAVLSAHETAMAAGQAGYLDPSTGLFVMTAGYLAERGWCCGNGCRHCPFVIDE